MATIKQMQAQIDKLQSQVAELLGMRGQPTPELDPTERPDYIAHGSPEHATFLGLIIVAEDEIAEAEADRCVLYKSRKTNTVYRLLDEITILRHYPSIDPDKAARVVLRQKVGELESGPPEVPENAPSMWQPAPLY